MPVFLVGGVTICEYVCSVDGKISPQIMKNKPAKTKQHDATSPENPFVLLRSSLDHTYRISADTQRSSHRVQLLLGTFKYLMLMPQIAKDRSTPF